MGPDSNSALAYGGLTSTDLANTEVWNGTSWTELNDLATARRPAGSGTTSSALASGGGPPSIATTEEFEAEASLADVTVS